MPQALTGKSELPVFSADWARSRVHPPYPGRDSPVIYLHRCYLPNGLIGPRAGNSVGCCEAGVHGVPCISEQALVESPWKTCVSKALSCYAV